MHSIQANSLEASHEPLLAQYCRNKFIFEYELRPIKIKNIFKLFYLLVASAKPGRTMMINVKQSSFWEIRSVALAIYLNTNS